MERLLGSAAAAGGLKVGQKRGGKGQRQTIKRRGEDRGCACGRVCAHPRAWEGIMLSHVNVLGVGMRGSDAGGLSGKARERGKRLIIARHNCPRASARPAGHVSKDSA